MTLRRTFLALTALLLSAFSSVSVAKDNPKSIEGNWIFYITVDGAPPCQCISLVTLGEDGSLEGPANDKFSGDARGEWAARSGNRFTMTIAQNVINPDGSAGGLFLVKNVARQTGPDTLTGEFTFQIVANGGTVVATGKGTMKGVRLSAD